MRRLSVLLFVCSVGIGAVACSKSHGGNGDPDGGDTSTDTDTDSDTDTGEEWCPELETSCEAPGDLEVCDVVKLSAPRLIFPLSGRHIRDRRPRIIWEEAPGATQYRLEIALDRAFTDVVYRSTDYQPFGTDRFEHIVSCDLDCGVHFFRVKSVTAPECETGSSSYTWEMFVGMAPGDLDRDGVPDIAFWSFVPGEGEFDPTYLQGWAFFDLDEKGGDVVEPVKVVEIDISDKVPDITYLEGADAIFPGDTNGDGYADLAITYSYTESPDDFDSIQTRVYVFSDLREGVVKGEDDAVLVAQSDPGKQYHEESYGYAGTNLRFSDFNGDGFPDLAFTQYAPYSSTDFPSDLRVLFGSAEPQTNLIFDNADVVVPCPEWCTVDYGYRWGLSFGDVNGDGFGDIVSLLEREGEWHRYSEIVFGSEDLGGTVNLTTKAAILEPAATGQQWGDWAWGLATEGQYLVGDIDNDGFLELAGYVYATDVTELDPISTGGHLVLINSIVAGEHTFDTIADRMFVGGFTIFDYETTEKLSSMQGVGDLNGDAIDDLFFSSKYYGSSPPGRVFTVDGRPEWDYIHDVSQEPYYITIEEDHRIVRTIGDVDGDGINDKLYFQGIELSATGQYVEFGYSAIMWSFNLAAWPKIY